MLTGIVLLTRADVRLKLYHSPQPLNEEAALMQTAKLFVNGRSQAVRLPKGFKFKGTDVFIQKVGDSVILLSKGQGLGNIPHRSPQVHR